LDVSKTRLFVGISAIDFPTDGVLSLFHVLDIIWFSVYWFQR